MRLEYIVVLTMIIERGVEKHVELDNLSAVDVHSKVSSLLS